MKRFNPEKEINMMFDSSKSLFSNSKFDNYIILLLVIGCSILAMVGVTFSYKLVTEDIPMYKINVEIINGKEERYYKEIHGNSYSDTLVGYGDLDSITCSSGSLKYNMLTQRIELPYINSDVNCVIAFKGEGAMYLTVDGLKSVNDDLGTSFYYTGDAKNNYVKFNDMMFRIIRINGDGSLRIMLDESDLQYSYGATVYNKGNIKRVLNEWYKENFNDVSHIVSGIYDVSNYVELETDNLINDEESLESNVGTISAREAALILSDSKDNFIGSNVLLANANGPTMAYGIINNKVVGVSTKDAYTVKPVINIIAEDYVGIGTIDDPYVIKED